MHNLAVLNVSSVNTAHNSEKFIAINNAKLPAIASKTAIGGVILRTRNKQQ
jgi:hypothetical protein